MSAAAPGLLWLTRDFRFTDAPALLAALADGPLLPVFIIDRLTMAQGAASRWRLEKALYAFDAALRKRTGGIGVTVLRGEPETILPRLMQDHGIRLVHQADWPTTQLREVQDRLRAALLPQGARLQLHSGHLLLPPQSVRTGSGGAYRVYSPFARAVHQIGPQRPLPEAPARITAFAKPLDGLDINTLNLAPDLYRGRAALEEFALPAGEAAAFAQLEDFLDRASAYPSGRDRPDIEATSNLSEALALGEISPRSIWHIASLRAEIEPLEASGIGKFLSEILWREFAWHLLIAFPQMPERCWRAEWEDFPWRSSGQGLTDWQRGTTGAALVDAGLREMWVTGRMHNRVRMVVASWLTKHQLIDWRAGMAHFADCLTDWDPASNAMNWQWVAGCGPDAAPYFRIFNPDRQAEQYDPQQSYRRRWLFGFGGEPGDEAKAWSLAIPPSWQGGKSWRAGPASALSSGRAAALQALAEFRDAKGES